MTALVAIVGRPNVGKSTLLNRLVGRRVALVADSPGVTRDRLYASCSLGGRRVVLVDTGGFDPDADSGIEAAVVAQAQAAIEEAQLVLFVCDGAEGLNPLDKEVGRLLRRSRKPVLLVVNKIDPGSDRVAEEFHELGFEPIAVSASHGTGLRKLAARAGRVLEQVVPDGDVPPPDSVAASFCLLGRPNVGKSSIANRLLGKERSIVSSVPGTTRDAVDSLLDFNDARMRLVDTPGVRRRRSVEKGLEQASVMAAIKSLERSDVAVVVLDAAERVTHQDARLVRLAVERGRGLVLALNKIDLLSDRQLQARRMQMDEALRFVPWAPRLLVSAKTGKGFRKIMSAVARVRQAMKVRIPTGQLNRLLEQMKERLEPPVVKGRRLKLYYASQTGIDPPEISVVMNRPLQLPENYKRYLENRLREVFEFPGVPLRWNWKGRSDRRDDKR
ncbi:MAG: ribosome biogenesis GTPase Der [Deltaproteobacteria bacterium]|nr:MAG: ribosome biogenesis GTPase Der [Deltaproteobacteria bacterium]